MSHVSGPVPGRARRFRRRRGGDRGIAVVFFAISLTAMLAVGALVLGGSVGYTATRNAQTAADSAALAGATALNKHKQNWTQTSADDLVAKIRSVVEANGAEVEACVLVTGAYGVDNDEAAVVPGACDGLGTSASRCSRPSPVCA
jgi:Flp pilus assembly protein TadG